MDSNTVKQTASDEISLKEMVYKIKALINYLITQWKIILLIGFLGAAIGFAYASYQKPVYTAALTFALEEEKSTGGISGALGLASSLGLDFGSGPAGGAFSGANIQELMKSRILVEKALLNPITAKGKKQSLADYFIEFTTMNRGWEENPALRSIHFPVNEDRAQFNLQQDSILGIIYRRIIALNGMLTVSQKDKKVGILTVEVASIDELFAKTFAETIARVVSDFYVDTKSKKAKLNYDVLQRQTDSIRNELNAAITGVAVANDNIYNLNPALNVRRTPSAKRQIDVQANTAILTQLVTNLEMAKVSLRKETPLIQVIDKPILPLQKTKVSRLKSLVLGGFFGVFAIIILLLFVRVWRKLVA
jgi:uncharacterized protein involved in exopolysaccharide biosynthesis